MDNIKTAPVIAIDTETTGLDSSADEILQLSIVSDNGVTLFNDYFKPRNRTEWADAEKVNNISPEMVKDCRYISEWLPQINQIFAAAEKIVGYNSPFDLGFLRAAGVEIPESAEIVDVMQMFAEIKGDRDEVQNGYKWHKLTECAEYCGYHWNGNAHDSLEDARATMYCYKKLADSLKISRSPLMMVFAQMLINKVSPPIDQPVPRKQNPVNVHKPPNSGYKQ